MRKESLSQIQTTGLQLAYNPVLSWPEAVQCSIMDTTNKLNACSPGIREDLKCKQAVVYYKVHGTTCLSETFP